MSKSLCISFFCFALAYRDFSRFDLSIMCSSLAKSLLAGSLLVGRPPPDLLLEGFELAASGAYAALDLDADALDADALDADALDADALDTDALALDADARAP